MVDHEEDPFAGVPAPFVEAMRERGFTGLTAVQRAVVDAKARDTNLRISSQTGSGKTVAIGLGLAESLMDALASQKKDDRRAKPRVLLIAPTRELAAQIQKELEWLYAPLQGLRTCVVTGGTDIQRERRFLSKGATIVVGTPGRTLDHIQAGALKVDEIEHVVLDEADHMLDMGFKDELDAITDLLPVERRSHLVSATFPRAVKKFADRYQPDALHLEGTRLGDANADIEHTAYLVRERDQYAALVNLLLLTDGARCLVFVKRRIDTADIAERLASDGFSALPFSGDLPQGQRTRTLNAFRNDVVRILVATDVAARGIDVADIATVVHIDLPFDAETYTHRSGRTGRAGQKGRSILLAPPRSENRLRRTLRQAKIEVSWSTLPGPERIQKALKKRARKRIHAAMELQESPPEKTLEYAEHLLGEYDPKILVARLIELARPELPREPMEYASPLRSERSAKPRNEGGEYRPFSIAFGIKDGATPARALATICRRGDIAGKQIGAIRIGDEETCFEVDTSVAEKFWANAQKDDDRHPEQIVEQIDEMPARMQRSGTFRNDFKGKRDEGKGYRSSKGGRDGGGRGGYDRNGGRSEGNKPFRSRGPRGPKKNRFGPRD